MKSRAIKRVLAVALSGILAALMLAGCGGKADSGNGGSTGAVDAEGNLDISQEVEISMYVISDRPAGQDIIDENLNKLLKEKLNCTLKINWIGWAEYANKYPLLFSSGEEFDMAYSATWVNFASLAQKGAFKSLDELWPTYAPENYAATSDSAKEQATINGHMYCVPTQLATYNAYGPIYRTDIVEGSGWDGKMESFEDLEEYLDIVKETHPEMEPIDQYSAAPEWFYTYMMNQGYLSLSSGIRNIWYDPNEENPQVFTTYEYEKTPEFLEMMARWNEKGFFSKSALSDTDTQKQINGKAAVRTHNVDTYRGRVVRQPDWGFQYANFVKDVAHLPYTQDCMVISNTSKNPERAMALWNLITTDQEVFDALMYGVKDVTYTLNENGQFDITDTDLYSEGAMWAARTDELYRYQVGTPDDFYTMREEWEKKIVEGQGAEKYSAFVFDTAAIETELAACSNVEQQYWWPLELAYTDSVSGLEEYRSKLEAAGIQKIVDEAQKQLDAYTAAH